MKKVINIFSVILLIITFAIVVILVFTRIQGKTPQVFGCQLLRISSSSMEPRLRVGDVILSQDVKDFSSLEIGDIVTYKGEAGSYRGKLITHEVVATPALETDGKYYLQTMGIANALPDPEISEDQVIGKMVCVLPFLGAVYSFFMTPWGLIVVLAILAVLFVAETINLFGLVKGKNSEEQDADDEPECKVESE